MPPLVSLSDIKTYLGLTGTSDDALIASCASNASAMVERDTGRIFAVASNVTRTYSTDGQAALTIHDRPVSDATRTVTLYGAALVEGTGYWLLQDRRNPDVSTTIQLRAFDRSGDWWRGHPNWFDANLDSPRLRYGQPNDLVIAGTVGHPVLPLDVKQATLELAALLYWQAKSGASGVIVTPTGEPIDLAELQTRYAQFVRNWRVRTGVAAV